MTATVSYYRYWGKASSESAEGTLYHSLPYHCLDVAAVGDTLLRSHTPLLRHLSALAGMESTEFQRWAAFLLALHDIGKFAVTFQGLRPDLLQHLQTRNTDKTSRVRHDTLGYLCWQQVIRPEMQRAGILPSSASRRRRSAEVLTIDTWMAAMTGHHGRPPEPIHQLLLDDAFEIPDQQAALEFVKEASEFLLTEQTTFPPLDPANIRRASWWLAGFGVLCDWIGSNRDFFPYEQRGLPLENYWEKILPNAQAAIQHTGLLPKLLAHGIQLQDLIGSKESIEPTPLQQLASQVDLTEGPQLFIMEDVTGAGKTEAALMLVQRLMENQGAHGLYLGLPTMATANAMYKRLGSGPYQHLFQENQNPSLVLAHGSAHLSDEFRRSLIADTLKSDGDYEGMPAAAAHCTQWLADTRKKALLADVGIGTLDQALLAILPSRHQSLRLLGLIGKVLLIDEVHACDAYMHTLLCALLQAHASAGGSAILLSATLPQKQRQELTNAFSNGLDGNHPRLSRNEYPLLTSVSTQAAHEVSITTRESVRREVHVSFLASVESVTEKIEAAVTKGQCVCWIRNTVADAREAHAHLHERHPDWKVDLFHARFALADRLEIEQRVLKTFGKHSRREDREGRILIATQVVEQSLDIDFDQMITDLAPIDLIIQRAGRLRRHQRSAEGDPIEGNDQRGKPLLHLHTPEWNRNPDKEWFSHSFPGAAFIYPDHGQLWLGLKLLREHGSFRMPEDARTLIEGVYGEAAEIPDGLQSHTFEAQGTAKAGQSIAMLNTLSIGSGYNDTASNCWWDDTQTPTRLGEPTSTVWLARWDDGRLKPWCDAPDFPWQHSSLSMRSDQIIGTVATEEIPQSAIDACIEKLPAKGKWGVLLPLRKVDEHIWSGKAINEQGDITRFHYSPIQGLITEKELNAMENNGS